jgi:nucleoredoxin
MLIHQSSMHLRYTFNTLIGLLVFGLSAPAGSIHESQEWKFRNGETVTARFHTAYGKMAYFHKGKSHLSSKIYSLSESDQARIVRWSRERDKLETVSEPAPTELSERFRKDAKKLLDGKLVDPDWSQFRDPEFYAIFTSASWCGPCRKVSPALVGMYSVAKKRYGDRFEMILCSWDQTKQDLIDYMEAKQMPWYVNWARRKSSFWRGFQGNGIPCMVIVDRHGYVYSHSYAGGEYKGAVEPFRALRELLYATDREGGLPYTVPTPGIDHVKLASTIEEVVLKAQKSGEDAPAYPLLQPAEGLKALIRQAADVVEFSVELEIDAKGFVCSIDLLDLNAPALEDALQTALLLWHFMPTVSAENGAVSTILRQSFRLPVRPELLAIEEETS